MEPQAEDARDARSADSGGAGGPPLVAGAREPRSEERLSLLLRLRAQTKQQLLEYKSMIDANEEKTPEQIIQEKQMEARKHQLCLSSQHWVAEARRLPSLDPAWAV
ncbi:PREDICTED: centromere protein H [Chinchilla lanigera]|uniref:centromere protein H n=1 Tax=Chinchilla lanigera TaxID=34839 RepID=UPI00069684D7|nr:PREDICTED: centromere protein H [Chinchilla lanigera]